MSVVNRDDPVQSDGLRMWLVVAVNLTDDCLFLCLSPSLALSLFLSRSLSLSQLSEQNHVSQVKREG